MLPILFTGFTSILSVPVELPGDKSTTNRRPLAALLHDEVDWEKAVDRLPHIIDQRREIAKNRTIRKQRPFKTHGGPKPGLRQSGADATAGIDEAVAMLGRGTCEHPAQSSFLASVEEDTIPLPDREHVGSPP